MTHPLAAHLAHCQRLNDRLHQLSEQEMAKLETLSRRHDPLSREQLHSARSTLALYTQNLQAAARLEQQLLRTDLLRQKEQRQRTATAAPKPATSPSNTAANPHMPTPQTPQSTTPGPAPLDALDSELDSELADGEDDQLTDEPAPLDDDAMLPPFIYSSEEDIRRWLAHPSYIPPHERAELRGHMAEGIYAEMEDFVRRGIPLPGSPESTQSVPL